MNNKKITDTVNYYLAKEFEIDENIIAPHAVMKDVLDLDSLDYIDLVVIIENNFNFKVRPDELHGIVTFQNLYDYIESRLIVND